MPIGGKDAFLSKVTFRRESKWYSKTKQELKELKNMATIEERAKEYSLKDFDGYYTGREKAVEEGYIAGATEQREIDIDKACNIFCHIGCPHKRDSYDCLKDKCDTWKTFRRMMEE